ncbi:MAG TPA: pyrroloquinoline quinone-dependent dehydrogenase [Woeseiaceae bacterium]|nr:pyrroloquinoline quinone-dependent dehydrogenase [Woeseiaceae bacterium]
MIGIAPAFPAAAQDDGWPAWGGDPGGMRHSPLTQIDRDNVDDLEPAWTFRTGELGQGVKDWERSAFEATPILYDRTLYLTTSATDVVAVDAVDGTLRWRHASGSRKDLHYSDGVSRGVSLWVDAGAAPGSACRARIYAPTLDGRLLALDAEDGRPCPDFGDGGALDLTRDVNPTDERDSEWRNYLVTSPPAIVGDIVVVGSSIGDNRAVREELGIVRAFDARTGEELWRWDPIPRDAGNPVYGEWDAAAAREASAANAWAPLSVDAARKLVFVPTGSASPDFYGGERRGDNRWANSLVALEADTGRLAWGRQLVHHDLWDYDLASQPTLVTLTRAGRTVDAVVQATKMGLLFTFERATGEPVFAIEERPVPQDAVPGEHPSPTQPFPVAPPPLVPQGAVTPDDAWGVAFFDRRDCRKRIETLRSQGIYQPPSTEESIMQPGNAGGINWGGLAFDPARQVAVGNAIHLPFLVALVPRAELAKQRKDPRYAGYEFAEMAGTPYGMRRRSFMSNLDVPCVTPPWGTLFAVDMRSGEIAWQVPLGQVPVLRLTLGMPNLGGPIVTASGLVFIAASFDDRFRAFDVDDGTELWETRLPAGGQATPMTYAIDGRQYVVIAAGGYKDATTRGDYVLAFALPR